MKQPSNVKKGYNVLQYKFGADELGEWQFYEDILGEFLATFILVFIGIGAAMVWKDYITFAMQTGLAMGITVSAVFEIFGHRSGGLANPAVAISFLASAHISFLRCIFYIIAQIIGGLIGAGLFKIMLPEDTETLGLTHGKNSIYVGNALLIEFIATLLFVLVWQACWDPFRADTKPAAASIIGFTYTAGHGLASIFSGASMNPARSFGPATIMNDYRNQWVYWVGPITAGILGGLFYKMALMANPPERKKVNKKIKKTRSRV